MKKSFPSDYSVLVYLSILLLFVNINISHSQTHLLKDYTNKFSGLKEKSKEFKISGNIAFGSKYRFAADRGKRFEYNALVNINISYFGISVPISYRLTSGRSLIGLNSPNINIPKFRDFGISPNYKHYTLHLGTRQMQFTPYTYNGIRFQGIGLEILPERGFFTKVFRGKLKSPFEEYINLTSKQSSGMVRKGVGVQTGYKTDNNEFALTIFKAEDQRELPIDSVGQKPKENAVVSFKFEQKISELLSIQFERSISAYTKDLNSPRINITTHTTGYNMLGLFTRRLNSTYTYATKGGLDFNLNSAKLGLKYEVVDLGYKTLGTIFLDNDFRSYSLTFALPVYTKLFLSGEIGIRNQGLRLDSDNKDKSFIGMFNASYQFSNQINSTLMVSNLRSTQSSFSMINGLLVDSLRLTLSNKLISTTTNIILGEKKDANLNFLASYIQSTQIRQDSLLLSSQVHTSTFNIAYSKRYDKLTSNYMLLYTRNITDYASTNIIGLTATHNYRWSKVLKSKHTWNSNIVISSSNRSLINLISNSISFISSINIEASITHRLLLNAIDKVTIKDHFIEVDCRYKF